MSELTRTSTEQRANGARRVRGDRVARGLCPNCGKEATPYYLCHDCRFKAKIMRVMNRAHSVGGITKRYEGRGVRYRIANEAAWDTLKWRPDPKGSDRRLSPRIGRVRVDFEATLLNVMRYLDRPATVEEIMAAWGRLRDRRSGPLAGDLARIIVAEERRKAKAAKRLRLSSPTPRRTPGGRVMLITVRSGAPKAGCERQYAFALRRRCAWAWLEYHTPWWQFRKRWRRHMGWCRAMDDFHRFGRDIKQRV